MGIKMDQKGIKYSNADPARVVILVTKKTFVVSMSTCRVGEGMLALLLNSNHENIPYKLLGPF